MKQTTRARLRNLTVLSRQGSTHTQWIVTIIVNLSTLSYGLLTSWPACVAKVLQSDGTPTVSPLSALDIAWLASVPSLTAMVAILAWTYMVDRFGRKPCLIICAVFNFVGWMITYFATNMATLVVARAIGGAVGSGCYYIIPIYIKEISQDDLRGALGLVLNTSRNLGVLLIYLMGGHLEYYTILYIIIALAVVSLLLIFLAPESPTFYVKIGQIETAASTIANMRNLNVDDQNVQNAINSIKEEDERFKSVENVTFIGIFKQRAWCRGFTCMILLMLCHGFNGGFSVMNLAPAMLELSRVAINPELQGLSVPVFMIIGSFLSMLFIERLGRKPILVSSFVVSMLSFGALAAVVMIQRGGGALPDWVSVLLLAVPVFAYAAAVSPLPFVIMAEMFNFQIRAKVMCCLVMLGWGCAFMQTILFGQMSAAFGPQTTYIFFSAANLCGVAVVLVLLPETRGKYVAEIELEFEK